MKRFLLRFWYKLIKKSPANMPMVRYWKTQDSVAAKVTRAKDGSIIMVMNGEDHPFPSFPRGHILFGPLSKLKHEIKNQVFNESWKLLEDGVDKKTVIRQIKDKLFNAIPFYAEPLKYDALPIKSMTPAVRELHRAWTKVAPQQTYILRDYLCLILQEDDAYRFRVQWLIKYFRPSWFRNSLKIFAYALQMLEHAEVIGDMKERIRLLRRILLLALEDKAIKDLFEKFCKEVNWKKVELSEADKYHFRGKYFKVDYDLIEY